MDVGWVGRCRGMCRLAGAGVGVCRCRVGRCSGG